MPRAARAAYVDRFAGAVCTVRYSPLRQPTDVREVVGRVMGSSHPYTHGSNAGDLILAWPDGDHGWRIAGDPWAFLSIGLATLVELEVFVPDPETKE